jgi:hypothetical protein
MKILIKVAVVLAILLVVAVVAAILSLNSLVKTGVETVGPTVTKVAVRLDSANISIFSGSGQLKGLFVGNPEGYKQEFLLKVGSVSVAVDAGSFLKDKIVVRSVNIQGPEINFEGGLRANNLTKLLENAQSATATEKKETQSGEKKSEKKLQVDEFVLTGCKVNVNLDIPGGKSASGSLTLPDIRLTGLGASGSGLTSSEVVEKVIKEITDKTIAGVAGSAGDLTKGAADAVKNLGKDGVGGVEKTAKGIGDLFKKK